MGFRPHHSSVLGVSHAHDGFIRHWPCGFISPRCHVQGSPFRVFPSSTAAPPRRWPVPSRRLTKVAYCSCPQRQLPSPRPQGFDPCRESVASPTVLPAAAPDPLLGLRLLQVLRLRAAENAFTLSSAHGLVERTVAVVPLDDLQRVAGSEPGSPLPRLADLREVLACRAC